MSKKIAIAAFGIFISCTVCAEDPTYQEELPLTWGSIITLSGGPIWANPGQNQYLYPRDQPTNYYYYTSITDILAEGELFFGLQRMVWSNTLGQLGLGVAGVSDAQVEGMVALEGIPDVYNYQYKVNHARIELKGKLISTYFKPVQPFVSGSFGAAWNNSHDYMTIVNNANFPPVPWFASNTTIAFAYTLGAGVQANLTRNWQVGVGYEFADLGRSILGDDQDLLTTGPRLTHLYTNGVSVSLSYLWG